MSLLSIVILSLGWTAKGEQITTSSSQHTRYAISVKGTIPVAFVITDDAVTIDFGRPLEVFKDVFLQDVARRWPSRRRFVFTPFRIT